MKRALIFDLDNTIYPVSAIADELFKQIFLLVDQLWDKDKKTLEAAKDDLTRRHFHLVADRFGFSNELKTRGIELLGNLEHEKPIEPFNDYHQLHAIPVLKYLVTTGFTKLQWSKVKMLGIEKDFEEIHIVDPETSAKTKKDVFADLMERHHLSPADVLVIGDDPESEIKAAIESGIDTFLFDPDGKHPNANVTYRSKSLKDVMILLL